MTLNEACQFAFSESLALAPGACQVRIERPREAWLARTQPADGQRLDLGLEKFAPTRPEPSRLRGSRPPSFTLAGRNRLEVRFGLWHTGEAPRPALRITIGTDAVDAVAGLQYTRFVREDLAFTPGFSAAPVHVPIDEGLVGSAGTTTIVSIPFGVRWNPLGRGRHGWATRPYLALGVGPGVGSSAGIDTSDGSTFVGARSVAARHNYSGFTLTLGVGWVFGKGC